VLAFIRVSGSGQSSGAAFEVRIAHIHARARGSGLETDFQTGALVEFRDGLIVRWEDFGSKEKALEAAGLRV
jgi:hypothetical protein